MGKYRQFIDDVDKICEALWQGKGVDIEALTLMINKFLEAFDELNNRCNKFNIEIPINYLKDAYNNLKNAILSRDDYILADCLHYEWREIMIVLEELDEEIPLI